MTTTQTTACPDPEVVGAFVEGRLGASERRKMMEHLDRCEACREEVVALSNFAAAPVPERATPSRWWLAAAASLVTIVGTVAVQQAVVIARRNRLPVESLVAASSRLEYRTVEARLSGNFGWAELQGARRSSAEVSNDPKQLKLHGEAGVVLERAESDPSAGVQHAAAIASLLIDEPRDAIERLKKLTREHPDDASAWNDLAAAYHAVATTYGEPQEDADAHAAVNRALKLDPKSPEARFNRALILEKLGLLQQARDEWTKYLELDSTSKWAAEARTRRDALPATTTRSQFDQQRQELMKNAVAGDTRFVARFPEESRRVAELATLGQWGAGYAKGDTAAAERELSLARVIGAALRAHSGEQLLYDAVATIDRASVAERARLAEAYIAERAAYELKDHAAARKGYLHAASLFGDSPAALNARYKAANASNHGGDNETALRELEQLSVSAETHPHYKALRAQIAHGRGWAEAKLVRWPEAIAQYKTALSLFNELGERSNAAFVSGFLAESWSFLGRRDEAWSAWTDALRRASAAGPEDYVFQFLNVAANAENHSHHPESAKALFDVAAQGRALNPALRAEILFRRAILSARVGDGDAAGFIADGKTAAAAIGDEVARENAMADLDLAEGIAFRASDPQRALASLTRAVGLREETRQMLLPATLFERARALRALGRSADAIADLESAVLAVEAQRRDVEWRDLKSGALDGVDEIYITLAELLLERGKTREAFITADRAAAHAFYGAGATGSVTTLDALQQRLDPGAAVVEYLVLPQKTIAFVVGSGTFETRETAIASAEVTRLHNALDKALRMRAQISDVQDASRRLDAVLIAPVRSLLRPGTAITFVPDPLIATVSFNALLDAATGRYLIQDHTVRIVPSALYRDDAQHERSARVVVIHPSAGGVDLPQTAGETAAIARLYSQPIVMEGRDATKTSILDAIQDADIVHYAGHTNSATEAGLLLRADKERPEMLYGTDIVTRQLRAAPLVVLAGCRTLRGGSRREDLATSLARAFLLAGARSVVGTTWDVDDAAAAAFFIRFHELNAVSGDSVAALGDAQRSLLQQRGRHPSDWAFAQIVVRTL
jgi:CHAT domain-containing protein